MHARIIRAAAVLLMSAAPLVTCDLTAQSEPAPGVTVRGEPCRTPGCTRIRGVVLAQRGDTLIVRRPDGTGAALPWTAADTVEVLRGTRSNMVIGAVGGAVAGLIGGGVISASCEGLNDGTCPEALPIGAGVGLVLGLVVGSALRSEEWVETVPQVSVLIGERRGVGISLAF